MSGKKQKYRWVEDEEYQDNDYNNRKKGKNRREERKLNTALRSKNYDYLIKSNEED